MAGGGQNNGHDPSKVGVGAHEGQYSELIRFGKVMEKHLLASWFFNFPNKTNRLI